MTGAVAAAALAALPAAAAPAPVPGLAHYHVRPDLRQCPSPRCGGSWVRRANARHTRCADGRLRRECYVALLRGRGVAAGPALVRGRIVAERVAGVRLGVLVGERGWRRADPVRGAPTAAVWRVRDTGVRCVTHPCFSWRARRLDTRVTRTLSDVDLSALALPAADRERLTRLLHGGGALLAGIVRDVPDAGPAGDGRVLVAVAAWLSP